MYCFFRLQLPQQPLSNRIPVSFGQLPCFTNTHSLHFGRLSQNLLVSAQRILSFLCESVQFLVRASQDDSQCNSAYEREHLESYADAQCSTVVWRFFWKVGIWSPDGRRIAYSRTLVFPIHTL